MDGNLSFSKCRTLQFKIYNTNCLNVIDFTHVVSVTSMRYWCETLKVCYYRERRPKLYGHQLQTY